MLTLLAECAIAGVAFHHAGLSQSDRATIERGYLNGDINVICCTSTLAAGVNLPCHFVIIKNTIGWTDAGSKEYSDLDMMQMLGRAGRPQFDRSAIAVVMTRIEKVDRYEKMVSGQEILESKLHLNLIEHLVRNPTLLFTRLSNSRPERRDRAWYRQGLPDSSGMATRHIFLSEVLEEPRSLPHRREPG